MYGDVGNETDDLPESQLSQSSVIPTLIRVPAGSRKRR